MWPFFMNNYYICMPSSLSCFITTVHAHVSLCTREEMAGKEIMVMLESRGHRDDLASLGRMASQATWDFK